MISNKQNRNLGHNTKKRNLPQGLGKLRLIEVLLAREGQNGTQGLLCAVTAPYWHLVSPWYSTLPCIIIPPLTEKKILNIRR